MNESSIENVKSQMLAIYCVGKKTKLQLITARCVENLKHTVKTRS